MNPERAALAVVIGSASETGHVYINGDDACQRAAEVILDSAWLADRDARAERRGAERVQRAIEDEIRNGRRLAYPVRIDRIAATAREAIS